MTEAAPVGAATSLARPAHPGFWPLPAVAAIERIPAKRIKIAKSA